MDFAARGRPRGGRGRRRERLNVRGFFERLQWKMAAWMQGRNGVDGLSNFLMGVGIILLIASVIPGLDLLSWLVLAVLAVALFRRNASYLIFLPASSSDICHTFASSSTL